jgi:four helix bundle protein
MNQEHERYDLRRRTMDFALGVLRLCAKLPNTPEARIIRTQLVKSGTSPGAHYREACRARSTAEFKSKMNGGVGELDESAYWFEMLVYSKIWDTDETRALWRESDELIRIFVTCIKNAKESA